jgi:hypothetical protein
MPKNNPTFEEVDRHIEKADLSTIKSVGKGAGAEALSPAAVIPNICTAYKIIRPILALILNLPFIPKKWKDALKAFMGVLDKLCP